MSGAIEKKLKMKTFGDIIRMCQSEGYEEIITYFSEKKIIPTMPDDVPCSDCADLPMSLRMSFHNGAFHFVYKCTVTAADKAGWGFSRYNEDCFGEKNLSDLDSDYADSEGECEEKFNWISESKFSDEKDLEKILIAIYWFVRKDVIKREQIGLECETSKEHLNHLENYFQKVLYQWLEKNSRKIGGNGRIVEIFERKDRMKGEFIVGIEKKSGNYFVVRIENCNADTLDEVVSWWIVPNTTVKSNLWEKLQCLKIPRFKKLKEKFLIKFEGQEKENIASKFNPYDIFKKAAEGKDPFDMFWDIVAEIRCPISQFVKKEHDGGDFDADQVVKVEDDSDK